VVGVISFCADVFRVKQPDGRLVPEKKFAAP